MSLSIWHPPPPKKPSREYKGEPSKQAIFEAVGAALHDWERMELIMSGLFARLCETRSHAARRAYGTIIAVPGKKDALHAAAHFFHDREVPSVDVAQLDVDRRRIEKLINTYADVARYRNNIAHGMVWEVISKAEREGEPGESGGFYLCAPPQATKHLELPDSNLSKYYYRTKCCGG